MCPSLSPFHQGLSDGAFPSCHNLTSEALPIQQNQLTSFFCYVPYPETKRNRMTEKLKKGEMWGQLPCQRGLEGPLVYLFQSLCLGSTCARSLLNCQLRARHPRDFWRRYYSTFLESRRGIISNADVNTSSFKTAFCSFPSSSLTFLYFYPIFAEVQTSISVVGSKGKLISEKNSKSFPSHLVLPAYLELFFRFYFQRSCSYFHFLFHLIKKYFQPAPFLILFSLIPLISFQLFIWLP